MTTIKPNTTIRLNNITKHMLLTASLVIGSITTTGCNSSAPTTQSKMIETTTSKADAPFKNVDSLPHYLNRDIKDEVFYFVMPDRFANGNTDNDLGSKTLKISSGGFDKTDKGMYHGGDLAGLQQKLPYLKSLGVSAIWLTPILRNQAVQDGSSGYHGYWVLDFTEIDPHLGSNDDLKALIAAAHNENIKIFFDIITNHTADVIKYTECHGNDGLQWLMENGRECPFKSVDELAKGNDYTTVIPKGHENLKTPQWLNDPKYYHNQGDSFWKGESSVRGDFAGLDDIDTNNPEVVSGMIDIFKNLITEFKPDGFRIDTVKHVNTEFWSEFSPALLAHAKEIGIPQFFMFGEVYSPDSKVLSEYTTNGNLQSVLDFGIQQALKDTLVDQHGTHKLAELFERDADYLDHDSDANLLLNFTGNHDMGRFAFMLRDSDKKYDDNEIAARNMLANAMVYFMRGIPIIYYGDEQGFVGDGGDQDSRQDMMPSFVSTYNDDVLLQTKATTADDNFDEQHPIFKQLKGFSHVYYSYPALRHGQHKTLYSESSTGLFAYSRTIKENGSEMVIVFNTSKAEKQATFAVEKGTYSSVYAQPTTQAPITVNKKQMSVTLPPLSFAIYQAK